MRAYKLVIGSLLDTFVIEQNASNPTAPAISFNVQHYSDSSNTTNSDIFLYNMPDYFYGNYANLFNKRIQLYAGFYKSALMQKIGYTASSNLILQGYITAVIPEYTSYNKRIQLIVFPTPQFDGSLFGTKPQEKGSNYYTFSIKKGMPATPMIMLAFNRLMQGKAKLIDTTIPASIIAKDSVESVVFDLFSLTELVKRQFGLNIADTTSGFVLYNAKLNLASLLKTKLLATSDFISQPSQVNLSTIALKLYMQGNIKVLDKVILPPNLFVGLEALPNLRIMSNLNIFKNKNLFTFFNGVWTVTKVWHIGDSRNIDADAWTTNLECVKELAL